MTRPSEIKPRDVDQPEAPFSVAEVGSTLPETRFSRTQEMHELVIRVEVWTAPAKVRPPCSTSLAGSTSAAFADDEPRGDIERGAGLTFARKITAENRVLRRPRDDDSKWAAARANRSRFTEAAAAANKRDRGLEARTRKPIAAA